METICHSTSRDAQVARYCSQYLQLEPKLDLPEVHLLRDEETQEAIYDKLFAEGAVRYGPPLRYQLRMLKELVAAVEDSIDDWDRHGVSESLMSALAVLLSTPLPSELVSAQQQCYVSYHQSSLGSTAENEDAVSTRQIIMLENRAIISAGGTTGLRTWEAALHLGQFLCENKSLVQGKRVLELGAGTGYLSILCCKYLGAEHVLASDGSDDVINNLPDNFFLNDLQGSDRLCAMDLKWGHALVGTEEAAWNGGRAVDVILGADITYDGSIIPALVGTILDAIDLYPGLDVYISATQRNHETFAVFLDRCRQSGLIVEQIAFTDPAKAKRQGPFYSDAVEIKICRIMKS